MNYSDSERVAAILEKIGYKKTRTLEETDLCIFNTCSIRQKGEDRVYGQLHNMHGLKKRNPRLMIGITGCMVRNSSSRNSKKEDKDQLLKRLGELDFVFRINDTHKLGEILEEAGLQLDLPQLAEADMNDYLRIRPEYTSKFQAFVPIQTGCDKYCTYCIVPYSRGREKSRPMEDIISECRNLAEQGCKEITLVGQTVNSYGLSIWDQKNGQFAGVKEPFVNLLTKLDQLKAFGLSRLRFTSPHPRDFTDALIHAHTELKTLTNHIHLPVQAGDDDVLKKMNRQYTVDHYCQLIQKIRKKIPDCALSTDIIVGFCGETAEQFERTYQLFQKIRWDMAYLARYSPRPGTTSFKAFQDNISRVEKAQRWHRLNDLLEECSIEKNKACEGKILEVLVEKWNETTGECEGKSRENKVVQFSASAGHIGNIVHIKIIQGMQWLLKGEMLDKDQIE